MRHTPLLMLLVCITLHMDAVAADTVLEAGTITHQAVSGTQVAAPAAVGVESSFGGPAAEPALPASGTHAGPFDLSTLLVAGLGLAGLAWMRRQARAL